MSRQIDEEASPANREYIRGAGGVEVGWRRIAAVLVGASVVVLLAFAIVLTVEAAQQNSRINSLRASGVPVDVTVSSCLGMASGTGITESGYQCRGTFTVGGHRYNEVIDGSTDLHAPGDTLRAVTVPSDPAILSTATAVAAMHASWTAFVVPAALFLAALLTIALVVRHSRARRR
jgi:hypothetical protein